MPDEPAPTTPDPATTWADKLKFAPWSLPLLYLLGGGTLAVGGMSLSLKRDGAQEGPALAAAPVSECATEADLDAATAAARAHHAALETLIGRLEPCEPATTR